MIGLQIYDSAQLADFIDGKNYEPLIAVAHRADYRVFSCLLKHGESFNTKENPRGEIQLDERLKKFTTPSLVMYLRELVVCKLESWNLEKIYERSC